MGKFFIKISSCKSGKGLLKSSFLGVLNVVLHQFILKKKKPLHSGFVGNKNNATEFNSCKCSLTTKMVKYFHKSIETPQSETTSRNLLDLCLSF